ncbi:MAG: homocysteine S-methyltransferase family protein [Clostridia bacterium]|nr:homocysteine S-methyltransferase family protein [Clostridia bacterium]
MDVRTYLKDRVLFLDGGTGTLLQRAGLAPSQRPEEWNLTHKDEVKAIARAYYDGGSNVVCTNTFGANSLHFEREKLTEIITAAVDIVKQAQVESAGGQEKFAALDIGPCGRLLKPMGDLDFEDAVAVFAETVRIGVACGVDLILIETMTDSYETKAALLAAKENCDLPVFVSNAYGADGRLLNGADPESMVALLEGMGADAIGANCSLGPDQLRPVVERLLAAASVPVLLKPNAGIPHSEKGVTVFDVSPEQFGESVARQIEDGVRIAGGCCGTTPEHIKALIESANNIVVKPIEPKHFCRISSYTHAVTLGDEAILIGERINPTGKKRFQQALREGDLEFVLQEGLKQQEKGVAVLDVNVGLADVDEASLLTETVCALQRVTDLPLQIDTANPAAMERALRRYNGKALINSVNGTAESMNAVFPLLKKYGGVAVALTLDEGGIPPTAEGRIRIARSILAKAEQYGIDPKDLIFDPLAMTVSADKNAATVTLECLKRLRQMGCKTSLGVSNISFGLPRRDTVNAVFFAAALEQGLSAAIMNPHSTEMMKVYYAHRLLRGRDENCADYIAFAATLPVLGESGPAQSPLAPPLSPLQTAVCKGLKQEAGQITRELLDTLPPLTIVNDEIIPALDRVGKGFEEKTVFLPQLLMSAEAAKEAFEQIKAALSTASSPAEKGPVVMATVQGDVHDIGKNIVKLLLENYGFTVIDLGKDVPPDTVVRTVVEHRAPLVSLSALMTTTVPAMEQTIRLLRAAVPQCKIIVGGAVLTEQYAASIGADAYGKDAMAAVRYAERILS